MDRKVILDTAEAMAAMGGSPGEAPYRDVYARLFAQSFREGGPTATDLREWLAVWVHDDASARLVEEICERWATWWEFCEAAVAQGLVSFHE
jgi:hypothetical protein